MTCAPGRSLATMKSSLLNSSTNGASTSGRRQCFAGNVRRISPLGPLGSSWLVAGGGLAHERRGRQEDAAKTHMWPFDQAWGPSLDTTTINETLPQNLFAFSIFPYAGFLYHLTKSKKAPPLTLFGFYFLLVFVFGTIPAGIYAKVVYHTSLANVDYLHGSAEFLLTLTNLFIVLGLRQGIRQVEEGNRSTVGEALMKEEAAQRSTTE